MVQQQRSYRKVKLWEKFLVGGSAGVFACCIVYPLDVIKTRIQRSTIPGANPVNVFKTILKDEGAGGFYRGVAANLLGVFPVQAVKLSSNDLLKDLLADKNGNVSGTSEIVAGAGAGFLQVSASNPMEITKIRLQIQSSLPKEQRVGMIGVIKELGWKGVYKGTTITWMRDVPYFMLFFPLNAVIVKQFKKEGKSVGIGGLLCGGCTAGMTAAFTFTPMDVIKTRVQAASGTTMEESFFHMLSKVYKAEGMKALYKGAVPRMCVQAPQFGIMMASFELQKRYIAYGTLFPKLDH